MALAAPASCDVLSSGCAGAESPEPAPEEQPLASLLLGTSGQPVWINNREGLSLEHDFLNDLQFAELDG